MELYPQAGQQAREQPAPSGQDAHALVAAGSNVVPHIAHET